MSEISDRLGARVAAKFGAIGHRLDFHLSDFRMAGDVLATISIGFDPGVGKPTVQNVQDYIVNGYEGKLVPHMSTLRLHAEACALVMNVSGARPSRDYKDIEVMVPNGPGRYIEASTGAVWEVEDNDGTPALYRIAEEDLDEILKARQARTTSRFASSKNRLDNLVEAGQVMAVVGANVMFFTVGGDEKVGTVMSEPDEHGNLSVQITGRTSSDRIHENQIHEMLVTAEMDANTKKFLKDYYTKAFGDSDYASQLVNESVVTGPKDELVAFLCSSGAMVPSAAQAWADTLRIAPHKVFTAKDGMILAMYNGLGFEWQLDMEKAEAAVQS